VNGTKIVRSNGKGIISDDIHIEIRFSFHCLAFGSSWKRFRSKGDDELGNSGTFLTKGAEFVVGVFESEHWDILKGCNKSTNVLLTGCVRRAAEGFSAGTRFDIGDVDAVGVQIGTELKDPRNQPGSEQCYDQCRRQGQEQVPVVLDPMQ
jgi:hypothetical protein